MFRNSLPVAITVLVATILLLTPGSSADDTRLAIPSAKAQKEALELIKSIFSKEYASTDDKDRVKLAKVLLDQASKPENAAAAQFTLLKEAVVLAADAGDVGTTLSAVEATVAKFRVNGATVKSYALVKLAKSVSEPDACKELTAVCFELVDELLAVDDFEAASDALGVAESAARKSRDSKLIVDVRTAVRDVQKARSEFDKVAAFAKTLRDNPTDPQANLEMGKYECFVRGDWDGGLPLLALGADAALSEIATRSIAAAADAAQRFELANDWWDLAEKRGGDERKAIQSYALTIYREVAPDLAGLSKTVAEKRIRDAAENGDDGKVVGRSSKKDRPRVINLLSLVNLDQDAEPRNKWAMQSDLLQCVAGSFVPKVIFPYQPPEEYDVKYVFAQPRLRNGVGVILPNRHGGAFAFGVGESSGNAWFLSVNGQSPEKRVPNMIRPGARYTVVVKIRKAGIQVTINGRQLVAMPADFSKLAVGPWHRNRQPGNLAIFCDDPTVFYQVEVNEVSGRGTLARQAATP